MEGKQKNGRQGKDRKRGKKMNLKTDAAYGSVTQKAFDSGESRKGDGRRKKGEEKGEGCIGGKNYKKQQTKDINRSREEKRREYVKNLWSRGEMASA